MNVTELLNDLAIGELSNLSMAEGNTILPAKVPQIIKYANEGLLRLYTKFLLKENDLILETRVGTTYYHLLKRFAYTQYDESNPPAEWDMPYIMDLGKEPFKEDVIKVLGVYDFNGVAVPLNDTEQRRSVFTPQALMLQVPNPRDGETLSVQYQAKHDVIPVTDYSDIVITLPEVLRSALNAYIASKVYMHMNTAETTAKGQEHSIIYEVLCQDAIDMDLVSTSSSTTNTKFQIRGWK